MIFCFRSLAIFKKQTTQIDMGVDVARIQLQSLSIFRDRLFWLPMFFQERTITVVRLRRLWRQTNGSFTFRSRLVLETKLVQNIGVSGMIFSVLRLDA